MLDGLNILPALLATHTHLHICYTKKHIDDNCVLFVYMKNMQLQFQIELILFCYRITYFNKSNGWLMLKYCWNISSAFCFITGTMTYFWATSGADQTSRIISCASRVMPELGPSYLIFWSPSHLTVCIQISWPFSIFTSRDLEASSLSEIPSDFG